MFREGGAEPITRLDTCRYPREGETVRLLRQLNERGGQGVFEVMVVIVLIAAMAVATPAYLRLQSQRADRSAKAQLVAAAKAADSYRWTHRSFLRMNNLELVRQNSDASSTTVVWAHRSSYCLAATVRGQTWSMRGPYTSHPKFRSSDDCS
jgi:Tfp pilus assembly protein PilE